MELILRWVLRYFNNHKQINNKKTREIKIGYHSYRERISKENGLNIVWIKVYLYFLQLLIDFFVNEITHKLIGNY